MERCPDAAAVEEETEGVCRVTVDTPSTNLVLKRTFALLNIPSFSDTTMNWTMTVRGKEGSENKIRIKTLYLISRDAASSTRILILLSSKVI